jgi:uncharacterized protein with HEPN domain
MKDRTKKLLWDCAEQADNILVGMKDKTAQQFKEDKYLKSAIERFLERMAIAFISIKNDDEKIFNLFEEAPRLVALKNRLTYAYEMINDYLIIWELCHDSMPSLVHKIKKLLKL